MCGAMATEAEISSSALGIVGTFLLVATAVCLIFALGSHVVDRFRPSPWYDFFVCHHKEAAQAQARYVQLLVRTNLRRSCFIDSDDLVDLSTLFDTVLARVGHLLVYLTTSTLTR